jgi:hypothetical protein
MSAPLSDSGIGGGGGTRNCGRIVSPGPAAIEPCVACACTITGPIAQKTAAATTKGKLKHFLAIVPPLSDLKPHLGPENIPLKEFVKPF